MNFFVAFMVHDPDEWNKNVLVSSFVRGWQLREAESNVKLIIIKNLYSTYSCALLALYNTNLCKRIEIVQWNLFITKTLGPWKSPCYIKVRTKKYKELGPVKLPYYKRVLLYPTSVSWGSTVSGNKRQDYNHLLISTTRLIIILKMILHNCGLSIPSLTSSSPHSFHTPQLKRAETWDCLPCSWVRQRLTF